MSAEAAAIEILKPVLEAAQVAGMKYAVATGRTVFLAKDFEYGFKYAARMVAGQQIGSFFPEIYEECECDNCECRACGCGEEEEEEEEECTCPCSRMDLVDDSDIEWTAYVGDYPFLNKVNECFDTWDAWEPTSPVEHALKRAGDTLRANAH